jgi:hypothetical protein
MPWVQTPVQSNKRQRERERKAVVVKHLANIAKPWILILHTAKK